MTKKLQLAGAAMCVLLAASLAACNQAQTAKPAVDAGKIADAIKADATQRIADVNAHDAAKVVAHDAGDAVSMRHGRPNAVGSDAIEAAFKQTIVNEPDLHVVLSDPTVDVAASGDMAVLRSTTTSTYTDLKTKKPVTTTSNSLLGYKLQPDGSWKVEWSVLSDVAPADGAAGTKG
ncbi:MAG TPA: nuclear transport factor 2 family protein [Caulobacteraceae bacterium]|nr:nuclear transport factor 2 family protein [Caulobacteraceae bacterium]